MSKYNNKHSWGGFFPDNVRKSIIKYCIESGDPANYFAVLRDVVSDIDDEWIDVPDSEDDKFWEELAKEL